jgi:Holliday junction resolvase RusA-like endonuclease
MIISLNLPLTPKALPRARHSSRNGYVSSYYLKATQQIFDEYQTSILNALNSEQRTYTRDICKNTPKGLYITLNAVFYMPIPVSWSAKRKNAVEMQPHTSVNDVDNLVKMILDRAEGILFPNDKLIYKIIAEKVYSKNVGIYLSLNYEAL